MTTRRTTTETGAEAQQKLNTLRGAFAEVLGERHGFEDALAASYLRSRSLVSILAEREGVIETLREKLEYLSRATDALPPHVVTGIKNVLRETR